MIWLIRHLYALLQQSIGLYFRNKKINRKGKPKCTVVAWNLSHNPVGRAFLFADFLKPEYDTKLVGPIFSQYGERLWKPLRGYPINIESFVAKDFPAFWSQAEEFASNQEPVDLVVICKPRLPSILIGLLIAKKNDAKVILDIDDHELSFFENRTPITASELNSEDPANLLSPHSESWTRYCESLIADFPNRTVSNLTLQKKFGGTSIPHVRDELFFNPWLYNRRKIRKKYGYTKKDKVILFLGTLRSHKGFMQLPEAIKNLNNPTYKICLIGKIRGDKMKGEMDLDQFDFIQTITDIKFSKLPRFLMIADLICLLQDVDSPVSKYQMPAKLSDALMMGIPVIATPVEPILSLAKKGRVEVIRSKEKLEEKIDGIFNGNQRRLKSRKENDFLYYTNSREVFKTRLCDGKYEEIIANLKKLVENNNKHI